MGDRIQLYNDPEEAIRTALDGRQSTLFTALPGIVTGVDLLTMTLTVQCALLFEVTDEDGQTTQVKMPPFIHVPIQYPMAGGFALTLPVAVNDEVLVIFASRCIDAWWQSGGIQKQIEFRMHDLSDGFAIIGIKSQPNVIPSISTTGAQLRNTAGTTYIELAADGKIKLVSPSEIDLTGPVKVTGDLSVTGNVNATLDVKAGTAVPAVEISLLTHTHTSATPGNPTGPPLP